MTITKVAAYLISISMVSVIFWAQTQVSLFDSIIPSFSNEKQRWINNKSKAELIKKLNKLMNPLGYIIIE